MMNKRGSWSWLYWILGIAAFIVLISFMINAGYLKAESISIDTATTSFTGAFGTAFKWMDYVFGGIPSWLVTIVGQTSAIIIVMAIFLLLFITFGDIIATFSTFGKEVSWISAFLIAVITANLKGIIYIIGFFIGIFGGLGGLAVLVGLGGAFVAFLAVNLGIGRLGPWVMRRKAMQYAAKSEAGAEKVKGAIKGMKEIGKELASKE
jgi:MFS family permease